MFVGIREKLSSTTFDNFSYPPLTARVNEENYRQLDPDFYRDYRVKFNSISNSCLYCREY